MDQSNERPEFLVMNEEETEASRGNYVMSLEKDFGNITLSSDYVMFRGRGRFTTLCKASYSGTHMFKQSHASINKHVDMEVDKSKLQGVQEEEEPEGEDEKEKEEVPVKETNCSRDEIIKINLRNHLLYISHCIKPDDLIQYLHCYSGDQKSDILSEKSPIRASRKALEILLHSVDDPGRFAALRDALDQSGDYPKIVLILDGDYDPEDKNFIRIVELFAPELIGYINPSELLPHLLQKGVFTKGDVQEITAEENTHGPLRAACILLMYLPRRAVDWYKSFLNILIDCKLEDTAELLDPDFFKEIIKERKNAELHGIDSIKHACVTSKANKPKILPKQKCSYSYHRDQDGGRKFHTRNSDSEDEIEYTEFNEEELEYVLGNEKERRKLEESMIYIDAKILWPEISQGKRQRILLRSLSKDEYTEADWSRKRKMWKGRVRKIFQEMFVQISGKKGTRSSVSKITKKEFTPCTKRRFKSVPTPMSRPFCENDNIDMTPANGKEIEPEPEVDYPDRIKKISECVMSCGRRIFIMKGSIVDMGTDAIVNTTNKNLSFATGMAESISQRGGETISAACRKFLQRQTSIDEGETFVCGGGNLRAEYVIHVNSPMCREGDAEEVKLLKQTVGRVLQQASLKNARSIAVPAIGCGNSGWRLKTAAPLIINAVRNFFREEQESTLRHVYVIDQFKQSVERFDKALREAFKDDSTCVIEP